MSIEGYDKVPIGADQLRAERPAESHLMESIRDTLGYLRLLLNGSYNPTLRNHTHDDVDSAPIGGTGGKAIGIGLATRYVASGYIQKLPFCNFTPESVIAFPYNIKNGHGVNDNHWFMGSGDTSGYAAEMGRTPSKLDAQATLVHGGVSLAYHATNTVVKGNNGVCFVGFKSLEGFIDSGTYVGTGAEQDIITGFRPELVMISQGGTSSFDSSIVSKTASQLGTRCSVYGKTQANNDQTGELIKTFTGEGFTLGTDFNVNKSAITYNYLAFRSGNRYGEFIQRVSHEALAAEQYPFLVDSLTFRPQMILAFFAGTQASDWRMFSSHQSMSLGPANGTKLSCRSANTIATTESRFAEGFVRSFEETGATFGSSLAVNPGFQDSSKTVWDFYFIRSGSNTNVIS